MFKTVSPAPKHGSSTQARAIDPGFVIPALFYLVETLVALWRVFFPSLVTPWCARYNSTYVVSTIKVDVFRQSFRPVEIVLIRFQQLSYFRSERL
jgi:hypothetical protein